MATIAADPAERGVAVGRVFGRGFAAIGHNPVPMVVLAILFAALPGVASEYLLSFAGWDSMVLTVGNRALPGALGESLAHGFFGFVVAALAQGALTRPVVAESQSRTSSLSESLAAAVRALVPLLILGAIIGAAVLIGLTLLIVPGILVYVLWSVAASALADEREGVFLALSRSQELGEGARWKILGITLIMTVASMISGMIFLLISLLVFGPTAIDAPLSLPGMALTAIIDTVWYLICGSLLASLYVELKQWKEGDSVESLEQVFA